MTVRGNRSMPKRQYSIPEPPKIASHTTPCEEPWVIKYQFRKLDDMQVNDSNRSALKRLVGKEDLPHMIFHGPSGTGKTSAVKCIIKELYGHNEKFMIKWVNAPVDRGIVEIRNNVQPFMSSGCVQPVEPGRAHFKFLIVEEGDNMTEKAQAMLRQLIETYSGNARICILCNNLEKIHAAIRSRCAVFFFGALPCELIKNRLTYVSEREHIVIDQESLGAIADESNGDMRFAINLLQKIADNFAGEEITADKIRINLGNINSELSEEIYECCMDYHHGVKSLKEVWTLLNDRLDHYNVPIHNILQDISDMVVETDGLGVAKKIHIVKNLAKCASAFDSNIKMQVIITNCILGFCPS